MEPLKFKEATIELKKPSSMTDEECSSLHIHQSKEGECISLWTTSFWNRLKFLFHGKLWLGVLSGKTQPPVWLDMSETIFIKEEKPNIKHTDYIKKDKWFAWRPVVLENGNWVWLKTVNRTIDERDVVYLGLLPLYSYTL